MQIGRLKEAIKGAAVMYWRIGKTTCKVTVHFSDAAQETMEDKIIRLIGNEVLDTGPEHGIMELPQMSRQPERSAK